MIQDFPFELNSVKAILLVDYHRCGIPWWAKSCEQMLGYSTIDLLKTVTCPIDVLCGTKDPLSPPEFGLRLIAGIDHAKLTVMNQGAHGFNFSHAQEIAALIDAAN